MIVKLQNASVCKQWINMNHGRDRARKGFSELEFCKAALQMETLSSWRKE